MFGMFESIFKSAAAVVTVPVALVSDVVTLGGAINDKDKPYTVAEVRNLLKNVENIATSIK